jgi:uncharacterized protein
MPTNLPPEYYKIEEQFRTASDNSERIELLEEMLRVIPKHKGTDHLRADLRRKLSKLKEAGQGHKGSSRQASAFHVAREGAGQVAVVGCTNSGKSSLLAALTNAAPEVSAAPLTTWAPTPGMMPFANVQIQLIDTPPLNPDYVEPELYNLLRQVDLILLLLNLQADPLQEMEDALTLLAQQRILPPGQPSPAGDARRYIHKPFLVVANRVDDERLDEEFTVLCELLADPCPLLPVSATTGRNLEQLKQAVFEHLQIMRVYSKPPGREPNLESPFVLPLGSTVEEFAGRVHKDFLEHLKSARVWGEGVFDGQLVGRDHVLHDGDVVELRI